MKLPLKNLRALILLGILVLIDTVVSPRVSKSEPKQAWLGALLAAIAATVGTVATVKSQQDANAKNAQSQQTANEWNMLAAKEAAMMQRKWALDDAEAANRYNSPQQQMQRLKEGGLNPAMIYGNGGANTTASMVKATNINPSKTEPTRMAPIDFSGMQSIPNAYMNARQAEMDMDIKRSQLALMDVKTAHEITKTDTSKFRLDQYRSLADSVMLGATLRNDKMQTEIVNNTARNEGILIGNELLYQKFGLNKQQALKLDAEIKSTEVRTMLNQLEANMLKSGRSKSDPYYIRALHNISDMVSQKTGVDVSIVSDILSAGSRVKVPKKRVKNLAEQQRENTDRWMRQLKGR